MELIDQITLVLGDKFFDNLLEISENEIKKIISPANNNKVTNPIKIIERFKLYAVISL